MPDDRIQDQPRGPGGGSDGGNPYRKPSSATPVWVWLLVALGASMPFVACCAGVAAAYFAANMPSEPPAISPAPPTAK